MSAVHAREGDTSLTEGHACINTSSFTQDKKLALHSRLQHVEKKSRKYIAFVALNIKFYCLQFLLSQNLTLHLLMRQTWSVRSLGKAAKLLSMEESGGVVVSESYL